MELHVILRDANDSYDDMMHRVAEPMHQTLRGNNDYIDSNIVLNVNYPADAYSTPTCTLYMDAEACSDKEYVREKAKHAIDLVIDKLIEDSKKEIKSNA